VAPIHIIEQHDSAYTIWRDAGVTARVLVHVDAHHDLYGRWFDKKKPERTARINIANFIYAAIADKLVHEIVWVVPDATWTSRTGRHDVVKELRKMAQLPPETKQKIHVTATRISGTVLGCPIHACTLENLPDHASEPVLLDIDIDYLVIPNVGLRDIREFGTRPWIWPSEFVTRLEAHGVVSDLLTVACSVEGGYTPLQWKYFADELACRLGSESDNFEWAECLRRGAELALAGHFAEAESAYQKASRLRPSSAAPRFHLANLCAASGRIDEAREHLRAAQAIDASYRTAFSTAGFWYLGYGRRARAGHAFERALSLDPEDSYACLGLGLVALAEKNWTDAERWFRRALALEESVDAQRGIARALTELKDYPAAIAAYEQSIKLALSGRRSIIDHVGLGAIDGRRPLDSAHGEIHERLGWLYAATGNSAKALAAYRMAVAMTRGSPSAWAGLARIEMKKGLRKEGIGALSKAALDTPKSFRAWWITRRIRLTQRLQARRDQKNLEGSDLSRPALWGGM